MIPARYPTTISTIKGRLIPLAVFDLMFLISDIGHEQPKQISITASNISDMSSSPFRLYFTIAFSCCLIYNKHEINIKFVMG